MVEELISGLILSESYILELLELQSAEWAAFNLRWPNRPALYAHVH
jgi:hypothetical protein